MNEDIVVEPCWICGQPGVMSWEGKWWCDLHAKEEAEKTATTTEDES